MTLRMDMVFAFVAAVFVHVGAFALAVPKGSVAPAGNAGESALSLRASSPAVEALVAAWESSPDVTASTMERPFDPSADMLTAALPQTRAVVPPALQPDAPAPSAPDAPVDAAAALTAPTVPPPDVSTDMAAFAPAITAPESPQAPARQAAPAAQPSAPPSAPAPASPEAPLALAATLTAPAVPQPEVSTGFVAPAAQPRVEMQTATPLLAAPQNAARSPAARPSSALLALTAPSAPTALAIDTAPAPIPLLDQSGKVQRSLRPSPRPQTAEAQAAAEAAEAKSQAAQAASAARRQQRAAGSGGGARAGSGSSSVQAQRSSASRASLQARWGAQIQSSIARFHGCGGLRGASGRAVVNVRVSRGGGLVSVRVVRSSGSGAIDRAAVASVRRTGGFPSAPAGLSGSRFDFQLPLSFRC